jgi:hypothetical protein
MLNLIEILFSRYGIRSLRFDGKMDRAARDSTLATFKKAGGPKVILIRLDLPQYYTCFTDDLFSSTRSGSVGYFIYFSSLCASSVNQNHCYQPEPRFCESHRQVSVLHHSSIRLTKSYSAWTSLGTMPLSLKHMTGHIELVKIKQSTSSAW